MTALAQLLEVATDDELRATRRLIHRAYLAHERLGWPSVNPFDPARDAAARRPVIGDPVLLAAACLEVTEELERRGAAKPCLPCRAEVAQSLRGRPTAPAMVPVGSVVASGSGV